MAQTWQKFEDIVRQRLRYKYWGFESIYQQEQDGHSKPDFLVKHFWLLDNIVVEAKHKTRITKEDVDKLVRDSKVHEASYSHLYISTSTNVSEDIMNYAKKKKVEVYRLGWNGKENRVA